MLLHGAFLNRGVWAGYPRILGPEFRVLAPNLAVHGLDDGWSPATTVERLAAEIRAMAEGSVTLVGWSLGGYTALALADAHPDLVERLVLIDASTPPRGFVTVLWGWLRLLELVPPLISARVVAGVGRESSVDAWPEIASAGLDVPAAARAVRALRVLDYWGALRRLRVPLLVLNGSRDWLFRATEARTVLAARDARLKLVPGVGHLAPLERPAMVGAAIRAFALGQEGAAARRRSAASSGVRSR